jgi:uncharacterized protein with HEPN domain
MRKDDAIRLRHMLDAALEAQAFAAAHSRMDLDIVWNTVLEDLPALVVELERTVLRNSGA